MVATFQEDFASDDDEYPSPVQVSSNGRSPSPQKTVGTSAKTLPQDKSDDHPASPTPMGLYCHVSSNISNACAALVFCLLGGSVLDGNQTDQKPNNI
jgi:hypothetical protein